MISKCWWKVTLETFFFLYRNCVILNVKRIYKTHCCKLNRVIIYDSCVADYFTIKKKKIILKG